MDVAIETRNPPRTPAKRPALPLDTSAARQIAAHADLFALARDRCLARLQGTLPHRSGHATRRS
jgi:hypothetical protein